MENLVPWQKTIHKVIQVPYTQDWSQTKISNTNTHTQTHTHGRGQSVGHRRRRWRYVADKKRRLPLLIFVSFQLLLWRHLEIPALSADCPENDATLAKGKHSAIVFAHCVCEEYGSTGNCLFMRDSLIEMVSQRANSVCVSRRFIMLYHADLRPNKLYVFKRIDRWSGSAALKKKRADHDVLVSEDMVGQWSPL